MTDEGKIIEVDGKLFLATEKNDEKKAGNNEIPDIF